ncbi:MULTISPECIES: gluconokinase [Marinomonas]|uniref:Gluconokinase n=1 Tax=Marinomonas arctica TaxID=383750 RepID=A0A7H1J5A8_9GAMM|nr:MULTISPECIES: gluconokinase [Marinomonas]MCS7486377.1 gluconate kinase [Marinomonas sp. BSi20414]QNT05674.1 gluconokinase [Marinomonas arctica]GGN29552.1 gluconokinase [Marinomonas arctica]
MMTKRIVVLGVSGSGKSLIGKNIADQLGYPFFDGDDFHSQANVDKMRQGTPLNDDDRKDWLATLNALLINNPAAVIACSGLKPEYRSMLRNGLDDVTMIYLKGDIDTIWQRHQKRDGHYFNGRNMLESQFATLIEPTEDEAFVIDISQEADVVLNEALTLLAKK